jgi:hypothetical protein
VGDISQHDRIGQLPVTHNNRLHCPCQHSNVEFRHSDQLAANDADIVLQKSFDVRGRHCHNGSLSERASGSPSARPSNLGECVAAELGPSDPTANLNFIL